VIFCTSQASSAEATLLTRCLRRLVIVPRLAKFCGWDWQAVVTTPDLLCSSPFDCSLYHLSFVAHQCALVSVVAGTFSAFLACPCLDKLLCSSTAHAYALHPTADRDIYCQLHCLRCFLFIALHCIGTIEAWMSLAWGTEVMKSFHCNVTQHSTHGKPVNLN
jgi:hypothetical protein